MTTKVNQFKIGDLVRVKHLDNHKGPIVNGTIQKPGSVKGIEGTIGKVIAIHSTGNVRVAPYGLVFHPSSLERVHKRLPPIKVGDKVKVYRKIKWDGWSPVMDVALDGRVLTVRGIINIWNGYKTVQFEEIKDTESGYYWKYPFSCIKRARNEN